MEIRLFYAQVCFLDRYLKPVPSSRISPALSEWTDTYASSGPIGWGSPNNPGCVFILNALFYVSERYALS